MKINASIKPKVLWKSIVKKISFKSIGYSCNMPIQKILAQTF